MARDKLLESLLAEAVLESRPAQVVQWTASGFTLIDHEDSHTCLGLFQEFTYRDGKSKRYTPMPPGTPIPPEVSHILVHGDYWLHPRTAPAKDLEDPPEAISSRFSELMKEIYGET